MKILFRQSLNGVTAADMLLNSLGIQRLYCKEIRAERDGEFITKKRHHHTCFEIHIVEEGGADYRVNGENVRLSGACALVLPPLLPHCAGKSASRTEKVSFTFSLSEGSPLCDGIALDRYALAIADERILNNLRLIKEEYKAGSSLAQTNIACLIIETIVCIFRGIGLKGEALIHKTDEIDARVAMAKQYVKDNVCRAITVSEVCSYCSVGQRQMLRLFSRDEGTSLSEYILRERCSQIERLLCETRLSLAEISEKMSFANEYYFNAFFTKRVGMTPGAYRKSISK